MVDALASDRSDQPFGEAVLPRRARGDRLVTDAHGSESARDDSAVDPILITDQVARGLIPRECLRDLTCDPFRGRIRCDVDPDKVSAGQPDDDQDIEQVKADCRNNEQVHGGDVRGVVTQEGAPSLRGRAASLDHVLRDAGLSDLEAELEQFAMDARRSPQRIFRAHPPDQHAEIRGDLRPASKRAGFPMPVPAEAGPMPTHEGRGPDDRDGLEDRWIQLDQEQAIAICELDATVHHSLQHNQLTSDTEACEVLSISAKASAALSRRCLQTMLHEHGYRARDLAQEIQLILDEKDTAKAIPVTLRQSIDGIRHFGNFSAHPITDVTTLQIISIESGEAEQCLETTEEMFQHFYVRPELAKRRKSELDAKLAKAGKRTSKS
jgi:hypothetical protein